jgi:hypothetical protein
MEDRMKSASVSRRSPVARRPGSYRRPELEHLECRNVPGSALRLSTLGADLGVLYQAALAPATQFEDLAQATQGASAQAPTSAADGHALPAPVLALGFENPLSRQALQDVLSQGGQAARALTPPGLQAAAGADPLGQAVQALVGGGTGTGGALKAGPGNPGAPAPPVAQVITDGNFSLGLPSFAWAVGSTPDWNVFQNIGCLGSEAMLGTVGAVNTLTQVSIYTPAAYYDISFDWANDDVTFGPSQLAVQWNGVDVFNRINPGPTVGCFNHFDAGLVYTGPYYSTLTIVERNDPSYFHITNVSAVG